MNHYYCLSSESKMPLVVVMLLETKRLMSLLKGTKGESDDD